MATLKPIILLLLLGLMLAACGKAALTPDTVVNAPKGLGIQGFDPVAYHTDEKATAGSFVFQIEYQGVIYRFASEQNKDAFEQEPRRYLPAYGGYCAYAMSNGDIVDINPRNWTVVDGQLYLNANIFAQGLFALDTRGRIERADAEWGILISSAMNAQE
ncbi:MAG: YHS domain-containing protein [Kordiimonadaceae bacterium]|nr:YHS domain-containing protein [Kordiimonadaceae bacterium]MBO6568543.1 YHS domain-containing protein [Kordiimonadaceae bacterium]MBO6963728.1 YHS domain-containing protein [Kordiimonadaceae bacterium]